MTGQSITLRKLHDINANVVYASKYLKNKLMYNMFENVLFDRYTT